MQQYIVYFYLTSVNKNVSSRIYFRTSPCNNNKVKDLFQLNPCQNEKHKTSFQMTHAINLALSIIKILLNYIFKTTYLKLNMDYIFSLVNLTQKSKLCSVKWCMNYSLSYYILILKMLTVRNKKDLSQYFCIKLTLSTLISCHNNKPTIIFYIPWFGHNVVF